MKDFDWLINTEQILLWYLQLFHVQYYVIMVYSIVGLLRHVVLNNEPEPKSNHSFESADTWPTHLRLRCYCSHHARYYRIFSAILHQGCAR